MLKLEREINGGTQKIYRFDNNYGASVVSNRFSYGGNLGLWELAVIYFNSENDDDFSLSYSTPITDDVIGHLEWDEVEKYLKQIESLNN